MNVIRRSFPADNLIQLELNRKEVDDSPESNR
jgi:hypothetical protein